MEQNKIFRVEIDELNGYNFFYKSKRNSKLSAGIWE